MTRPVPLDRLREISRQRTIRRPVPILVAPEEPEVRAEVIPRQT